MESSKLIIPGRPYNYNSVRNIQFVPLAEDLIQINPTNPRKNSVETHKLVQKSETPNKIKMPLRDYKPTALNFDAKVSSSNLETNSSLSDLKNKIESMRKSIKTNLEKEINLLKTHASQELAKLDEIEFSLSVLHTNNHLQNSDNLPVTPVQLDNVYNLKKYETKKSVPEEKKIPQKVLSSVNPSLNSSFSSVKSLSNLKIAETKIPNFLFSLSDYSKDLNKIEKVSIQSLVKGMSYLIIENQKVMITGGPKGTALIYDINSGSQMAIPKLKVFKSYHAMAFIGPNPAIIGGLKPPSTVTNSVEIFDNNKWVNGPSLNFGRSHANAIKHLSTTYVFGGISGGFVLSIEKFSGNEWEVMPEVMPIPIRNYALISYKNDILIFGGEKAEEKKNSVYRFIIDKGTFHREKNLQHGISFNGNGTVQLSDGFFYLMDTSSKKIIKYKID
jgi:hypothetical protein